MGLGLGLGLGLGAWESVLLVRIEGVPVGHVKHCRRDAAFRPGREGCLDVWRPECRIVSPAAGRELAPFVAQRALKAPPLHPPEARETVEKRRAARAPERRQRLLDAPPRGVLRHLCMYEPEQGGVGGRGGGEG